MKKITAIVPAAGSGSRMQSARPKQYLMLQNQTVIVRTIKILLEQAAIAKIAVILAPDDVFFEEMHLIDQFSTSEKMRLQILKIGGDTRAQTVKNALDYLDLGENDWALVHDAARCLLPQNALSRLLEAAKASDFHGGILALPVSDTLKKTENDRPNIAQTISREQLWQAQTPQLFPADILRTALQHLDAEITDEASAVERLNFSPALILGARENIKITHAEDLHFAETWLKNSETCNQNAVTSPILPTIRIGQGFDIHQLVAGRDLILGGVQIPHDRGLLGHSDADVLLHAIVDALLGALAAGDIGQHFPDNASEFKNIDSRILLRKTWHIVQAAGFTLGNLDCSIIAQRPKLAPHIPKMRELIAQDLGVLPEQISIKAKTSEKIGTLGREEGIAAQVSCLLLKL